MKLKITITGVKVHGVGYRVMFVNKALSLGVSNFNIFNNIIEDNQAVIVIIEGEPDVIEEFRAYVNTVKPDEAEADNISFEEYRNTVPPIERVMQSFQMEHWGKGIRILLKMLDKQDSMLDKQDSMLDKQDSMLDKQDSTISILKSVKEDTSLIPDIAKNTSMIPDIAKNTSMIPDIAKNTSQISMIVENTSQIPDIKGDTSGIKNNTREIGDSFHGKYEEMSREISQMKVTLSRIEAKVFG
ncbi:MAG: acylphosphatase [Candidatus Methanoperedens sp.]|jgi:acylphosphatase|nr:acylphosphatase [Candidatus Methanoperedens sp.]PKL52992.1 MAG: hypothetical protein CVV36_09460 [Candidatus Methanoperedenaceae archaeon HGW-Methanoperedenaceae-1]